MFELLYGRHLAAVLYYGGSFRQERHRPFWVFWIAFALWICITIRLCGTFHITRYLPLLHA